MKTPGTFLWIYGMPSLLAVAGCVGLAAALFADGLWDWISWLALGGMTAIGLWYALVPARTGRAAEAAPRTASPAPASRSADPAPRR
jgi:hypothetical protein